MSDVKKNWVGKIIASQLLLFVLAVLLMLGNKFSVLPFSIAFLGFAICLLLVIVLGVVGVLLLLLSFGSRFQGLRTNALKAIGIGVAPIVMLVVIVGPSGFSAPLIHDITTDFDNPPLFVKALELRSEQENNTDYDRETLIDIQKNAYPEIAPLSVQMDSEEVFLKAVEIVEHRGWEIVAKDEGFFVIEAVVRSSFFGFADDVVIRISKSDEGSRIDMRSSSRVGQGDFSANAKRIQNFLSDLDQATQE